MLMLTVVESKITKRLFVLAILLFTSFILIGCDDLGSTIDLYGEYDKITKTCEFNVAYTDNSSFLTDGAGYATLVSLTDGDTTNFRLPEGQNITIRYHGVDTPESTGSVEKWGKAASLFVKSKLEKAKSIVLEATSTPASHDSYGVRYLGYIWYKLGDEDPYKLLNLELVENGFSKNKCINTPDFKYYSYFKDAEDFAKNNGLRLHGNYQDPYYSTAAEKITLKDFYDNPDAYYNSDAQAGSKVRIQAYITDLTVSGSGTYTFTATQEIDGVKYSMPIFAGYSSAPVSGFIKVGNLYSLTGNIAKHNESWQISGLIYVAMQTGGDYVTVLQRDYYCTFNSNLNYGEKWGTSLFSSAEIISAKVEEGKLTMVASVKRMTNDGYSDPIEMTFITKQNVASGFDASTLVGDVMSCTGLQIEKNSNIITVSISDINFASGKTVSAAN